MKMKKLLIVFVGILMISTAISGIAIADGANGKGPAEKATGDFNGLNVVEISGGWGVTAVIINTGTAEATNIPWSIYFCSGLVFIGVLREGTINVPAGGETTIRSGLVFGFGPGSITVTAGGASKIVSCFVLGPFVLGIGPYP